MKILVINPGGTSTKISVFEDEKEIIKDSIFHEQKDLEKFNTVFDQMEYRKSLIIKTLDRNNFDMKELDAVSGRGGLMKPIPGGTYRVNEQMVEDLRSAINGEHASNLGAALAYEIGKEQSIPSFVVDPVSVDEFDDISRITGIKEIEKKSWLHSLNHKAVSREVAKGMGKKYKDCNFISAHLGSGNSIVAHKKGKMIDGSGGRSDGPFSPERSGGLLAYQLVKLCYSGKYTQSEMINKISNTGGFYDYLGTKDMVKIQKMVEEGDKYATLIFDAYVYQIAKEISMFGASLFGEVDKIILSGGIARSQMVVEGVKKRVEYLAPIEVVPGEMEMEALAKGVTRVLTKEEVAKDY